MGLKIALAFVVFAGSYADPTPAKCDKVVPMCKYFSCVSTTYPNTEGDRIATILRNVSCNGKFLLPIVRYEKIWSAWGEQDLEGELGSCTAGAPNDPADCPAVIATYQCAVSAVASKIGTGEKDAPFIARLVQFKIAAELLASGDKEPHPPCMKAFWNALNEIGNHAQDDNVKNK
ncbi:unnamed protein product, partial [Mesorhabditis spiculigera]